MLSLNSKHVQHVKILIQNCMVGRSWHGEYVYVCSLNLTFISNSFWNKERKVLKCWKLDKKREITPKWVTGFNSNLNCKHVQHVKICLPCNFEVNPVSHFGVISLFSSNFQHFNTFRPLFQQLLEINVKFKLQTCSACHNSKMGYRIYFKITW
jgi:hypothetical protein